MREYPKRTKELMVKAFNSLDAQDFANLDLSIQDVEAFLRLNIGEALDVLSDIQMYLGFDENYDLTDFGRELQNLYDDIYYNAEE